MDLTNTLSATPWAARPSFVEGVDRYLTLMARDQRQQLLAELRQAPTLEALERYWQHKNPDDDDAPAGLEGNSDGVLQSK